MIGATASNGSDNGVSEDFDILKFTHDDLKEVSSLGYTVHNIVVNDPKMISDQDIKKIKDNFNKNSLIIGQTNGRYGGDLVNPDQTIRGNCIKFVQDMCELTSKLEAPNTYLRPGSINTNGPWLPHPENHTDKVFDRLVNSTKEIINVAENEGVMLSLEGGYVSPIFSAKRAKEFIDAVGSKNLGFNQDPVNFISSIEQAYNTREFLEEFFTLLGKHTLGAHLKDFAIIDTLLLRFEEEFIGSGMMDQAYFLKRMNEICPDAHILVEHIPRDKFEPSYHKTIEYSNAAGIEWESYN
jgi:sugar phosphate isomerase/epimerase